ncbi:unnamed protein product, partial [Owenia fusiformis]
MAYEIDNLNYTAGYDVILNYSTAGPSNNDGGSSEISGLKKFGEAYGSVHGYLSVAVCIFGLICNSANIIVLTRKNMISSTNTILLWLAVADLLTMTSYLPIAVHFYILKPPDLGLFDTRSVPWIHFFLFHINYTVVCHTIAIWLTITLATFRFLYIYFPTRGMTLCSLQRAKLSIALVYIITVCICVPNFLCNAVANVGPKFYTSVKEINGTNVTIHENIWTILDSNLAKAQPILIRLNYWIQALFIKIIPCILLTVLTIVLIVAMNEASKRRMRLKSQGKKNESDRSHENNRTTKMLLAVVVLFLITELPHGILTVCNIFITNFYKMVYAPLGDVFDILALINNSVNFVLYCTMSRQFRTTFIEVFSACCPSKPNCLKNEGFKLVPNG